MDLFSPMLCARLARDGNNTDNKVGVVERKRNILLLRRSRVGKEDKHLEYNKIMVSFILI